MRCETLVADVCICRRKVASWGAVSVRLDAVTYTESYLLLIWLPPCLLGTTRYPPLPLNQGKAS